MNEDYPKHMTVAGGYKVILTNAQANTLSVWLLKQPETLELDTAECIRDTLLWSGAIASIPPAIERVNRARLAFVEVLEKWLSKNVKPEGITALEAVEKDREQK